MFVYTMFQLGEALAHNIETLLVCRFLAGLFASSPLTNAGARLDPRIYTTGLSEP